MLCGVILVLPKLLYPFVLHVTYPPPPRARGTIGIQFTLAGVAGIGVVTSNAAKVRKAVAGFALLKTFANLMGIGIAVVHSGPDEFGIGV